MFVFELPSSVNAARGLPMGASTQDIRDEHSLVAEAKSGYEDAFGELYKCHQRKAYRTALRILRNQQDAEDAVQRAFQRALLNLQRFREDSTFSTWLTRIVVNEALMLLRQRAREPLRRNSIDAAEGNGSVEIADDAPTPEDILCESERRAALLQAIGRLRRKLRIVVLGELQGLTSAETARRLGLSVSAVKGRTFHARRFLRSVLNGTLKEQVRRASRKTQRRNQSTSDQTTVERSSESQRFGVHPKRSINMKTKSQLGQAVQDEQIRAALDEHWKASDASDFEKEHRIYLEDAVLEYPQSGERTRGRSKIQTSAPASRTKSGFRSGESLAVVIFGSPNSS